MYVINDGQISRRDRIGEYKVAKMTRRFDEEMAELKILFMTLKKAIFISVFFVNPILNQNLTAEKKNVKVEIDTTKELANVERKPGGFLTCWLLDSDKKRPRKVSMVETYKKLGVQSVRFPFGQLSNNYVWTTAPYENATKGLTPRIGTKTQIPGKWEWGVDDDGSFKKDLDFDEFIEQCSEAGIEPVIVINVMSHTYKDGPTIEALKTMAVEWVRYSNVIRKYKVKYWQLGNEQDHHESKLPLDEYIDIYGDFSKAMKQVDPKIKTGVAIISNKKWASSILKAHSDSVDFIGCHQYQWSKWTVKNWKEVRRPLVPNILGINKLLEKSTRKDAEIMVTEMSSFGKWYDGKGGAPDMFRTLCYAEMLLHASTIERVAYTHFWTTHSPWGGERQDGGLASALMVDNGIKPPAEVMGLINHNLDDVMVSVPHVIGDLRMYASCSMDRQVTTVFVINKNDKAIDVELEIKGIKPVKLTKRITYVGASYLDLAPRKTVDKKSMIPAGTVSTTVPGISLTILKLSTTH